MLTETEKREKDKNNTSKSIVSTNSQTGHSEPSSKPQVEAIEQVCSKNKTVCLIRLILILINLNKKIVVLKSQLSSKSAILLLLD